MTQDRQIYLLDPKELSPETIAVAFAKTSRSPQSFREITTELNDEKSAEFHEKWVVGYGHSSVAEHAVLHLAVENVSRLAIECLESNRLASYTEKSTRYQKWDQQAFYTPPELEGHPLRLTYQKTCEALFEAYQASLPLVREVVGHNYPQRDGETEAAWDRRIRSRYVDVCRYLLPASSLANVGITANARVLEHAIGKMLSNPLAEVREIGEACKRVSLEVVPTLIKYANPQPYLEKTAAGLRQSVARISLPKPADAEDWCVLVDFDPFGEVNVLAAGLARFGEMSYTSARAAVKAMHQTDQVELAGQLLRHLGPHDEPIRELEHTTYTFDVVIDQGAYFELKRHRMMTQTPQALTVRLGYAVPSAMAEAGFETSYREAMQQAADCFEQLYSFNPDVAAYVVPNGYLRRVILTMNLRSAFHLCELRSADNAHFAMRRLAQRIGEQIRAVHPVLGSFLRVNPSESWDQLDQNHFLP